MTTGRLLSSDAFSGFQTFRVTQSASETWVSIQLVGYREKLRTLHADPNDRRLLHTDRPKVASIDDRFLVIIFGRLVELTRCSPTEVVQRWLDVWDASVESHTRVR
jgi:hypothetical protein